MRWAERSRRAFDDAGNPNNLFGIVQGGVHEPLRRRSAEALVQIGFEDDTGVYTAVREDAVGLYVEGKLALKTARGAEAYELLKMRALSGLSIGFVTREDSYDKVAGVRTLKKVDLWEVSLVTFPANDAARISGVKKIDDIKTLRDAEAMLRDACGLDRGEAKSLLARLRDVFAGTRDAEGEIKAAQDLLNRIREGARK